MNSSLNRLPEDFAAYTRELFGEERWERYLASFNDTPPVSIRLNPFKATAGIGIPLSGTDKMPVPWCRNAWYLAERPDFTADPLLHAGTYYVQEAASMFLDEMMRQLPMPVEGRVLDLCAAPGGKSTLMRAVLADEVTLYSNEPNRKRANILMENMQKQGHHNVVVTNNFPADYQRAGMLFDMILTDVPCSGEGMFRKDAGSIEEWSLNGVMKCQQLQREIVETIWPCLKEGGILVYSTCTFNTREDEENVKWIMDTLGASPVAVSVQPEWQITGSLLKGFDAPVYRFIPGISKGEGLFMAVMRKTGGATLMEKTGRHAANGLHILSDGNPKVTDKAPAHAEALLAALDRSRYPMVELTLDDALRYLHREALVLPPDTPRGFVIVTYQNIPLGFMKNIGTRANNLYPQEWRIRRGVDH